MAEDRGKPEIVRHMQEQIFIQMYRRSMTQKDLGAAIGLSQPTVSRILSGDDMSMSEIDRIVSALDLELTGVNGLRLVPRREQ